MKENLLDLLSKLETSFELNEENEIKEVLTELLDLLDYCNKKDLLLIVSTLSKYKEYDIIDSVIAKRRTTI